MNAAACSGKGIEAGRIAFLLARDGEERTLAWVRRTLGIYRRAVLHPRHFASTEAYRRKFLASCADFRRWLAARRARGISFS
ncbi:MAG TPA: hypothetical protein VJ789_12275 [Burkholderiales bacterium]|nr:hypothetical protein [Burkholderiales bacterium]